MPSSETELETMRPLPSVSDIIPLTTLVVERLGGTATTQEIADYYRSEVTGTGVLFAVPKVDKPNTSVFRERISRSCARATESGLLERLRRGVYRITDSGLESLSRQPHLELPEQLKYLDVPSGVSEAIAAEVKNLLEINKYSPKSVRAGFQSIIEYVNGIDSREINVVESELSDARIHSSRWLQEMSIPSEPLNSTEEITFVSKQILTQLFAGFPANDYLIRYRSRPKQVRSPLRLAAGAVQAYLFESQSLANAADKSIISSIPIFQSLGLNLKQTVALDSHLRTYKNAVNKHFKGFPKKSLGQLVATSISGPIFDRWAEEYYEVMRSSALIGGQNERKDVLGANLHNMEIPRDPDDLRNLNFTLVMIFVILTAQEINSAATIVAAALEDPGIPAFTTLSELGDSFLDYLAWFFSLRGESTLPRDGNPNNNK